MEIKKIKINDLTVFIPLKLKEKYNILSFFTTRNGGFGSGKYDSLNIAYHVGDDPKTVKKNRLKILNVFGYDDKTVNLVSANQIHSSKILIINERFLKENPSFENNVFNFNPSDLNSSNIFSADGMITGIPKLPLMVMGADCNLILFADIRNKIIAAVHAGWKGVLNQIALNVLDAFKDEFNSNLKNVYVFFGPSIRKCCFRVSEDIFDLFYRKFNKTLKYEEIKDYTGRSKYFYIDLINIILNDMIKSAVLEKNIFDLGLCTCCNPENLFFSYRKEQETGRQAGIIMIE